MIVCVCNNVNAKTIEDVIDQKSLKSISDLQKEISICNQCKTCTFLIEDIIACSEDKAGMLSK